MNGRVSAETRWAADFADVVAVALYHLNRNAPQEPSRMRTVANRKEMQRRGICDAFGRERTMTPRTQNGGVAQTTKHMYNIWWLV
jgi:hypothetical protein